MAAQTWICSELAYANHDAVKDLHRECARASIASEFTLLREVMNTVGRPGRLGEQIGCVVRYRC